MVLDYQNEYTREQERKSRYQTAYFLFALSLALCLFLVFGTPKTIYFLKDITNRAAAPAPTAVSGVRGGSPFSGITIFDLEDEDEPEEEEYDDHSPTPYYY